MMNFEIDAEISGTDPERGIGVETFDRSGNYHYIIVDWDGNIAEHEQHDYPLAVDDMTDDQVELVEEVQDRAIYKAHVETEGDFVHPNWDPRIIDRGIQALDAMPTERFADEFEDIYEVVHNPSERAPVPVERVLHFIKYISLTPTGEVNGITPLTVQYVEDGESYSTRDFSDLDEPYVDIVIPPIELTESVPYPEEFREFLKGNLIAQIRDIYQQIGQEPPEAYKIEDMPGKPSVEVEDHDE